MKSLTLMSIAFLFILSACKLNFITPTTTTLSPTTTISTSSTVAPPTTTKPPVVTTTIPAPTTTQMPRGPVECMMDFGTGSKLFTNFDAVMAAAKAVKENFCINFAGVHYCAAEGGCFGPCSSCWPK